VTLWQEMGAVGGGKAPPQIPEHARTTQRQRRLGALVPQMLPYYRGAGRASHASVRIGAAS
jgi:hypothetical protein